MDTIPCVKKKADWAFQWIHNKEATFGTRVIAFAAVEGIFFSGSFCAIFWLNSRGLMPGLSAANQYISRDENIHCLTGVTLYSKLTQRLDEETVHALFREVYEIEREFITESLPISLIGMSSRLMKEYIMYVTDYWLVTLGYSKLFGVNNPFPFMEYISLENQTNFFEKRPTEYGKAKVGASNGDNTFKLDVSF